jgi:NADPH-dependent 2,4-dienoyl-CoA reductase/sulfur reductase-like enzyme
MPFYKYILVGGGMTAASAASGIREIDPDGSIAIFSAETNPPYDRPPLTKGLWSGKKQEEDVFRNLDELNVELHLEQPVERFEQSNQFIILTSGEEHGYDRLLLATGGRPRKLPFGKDDIQYYRTFNHYRTLREQAQPGKHIGVIGGSFIGSELAASLTANGAQVTMIFPENGIGGMTYPAGLSDFVTDYYREKGVEVLAGEMVDGVERRGDKKVIRTRSGRNVEVDTIVAGIGIEPNTAIASAAGLEVDNGIIVDRYLRTSQPDVYAAGDVASFYNPALKKRMRVEHEDNAKMMGRTAGRNMAGASDEYHYLPFFYSDLFDLGYEAVGELNPGYEVYSDWQEPFRKGVVYYLKDDRVRGVLLWNVWDQVDAARSLIEQDEPIRPEALKGRLPE